MIEVAELTKQFGPIRAVDGVGFSVNRGEVLGFLGPNGAGKSTTLRIIAGFLPPTSGRVLIGGRDLAQDSIAAQRMIGYMPESTPLYKDMTAREYLLFIAEIHGIGGSAKRVDDVIRIANLGAITNQLIETISKGYRSRLSFAAAIIHDPPILLLDEPTDGLDPNQKQEIRELIRSLSREKAIIVSTHILEEVEAMCSRVIIISEGRLVLDGTPRQMRDTSENNNRVVISLKPDDRAQAEKLLSAPLVSLGGTQGGCERFRVESDGGLADVQSRLSDAAVPFEEIFYYHAPLDEAFGKMTRTKE